jgi:hypothetical protein
MCTYHIPLFHIYVISIRPISYLSHTYHIYIISYLYIRRYAQKDLQCGFLAPVYSQTKRVRRNLTIQLIQRRLLPLPPEQVYNVSSGNSGNNNSGNSGNNSSSSNSSSSYNYEGSYSTSAAPLSIALRTQGPVQVSEVCLCLLCVYLSIISLSVVSTSNN